MVIYRVENEMGVGPYRGEMRDPYSWAVRGHDDDPGRPTWRQDDLHPHGGEWKSGFFSLSRLARWFNHPHERLNLEHQGFRVHVYEIPREWVVLGKSAGVGQLVFHTEHALHGGEVIPWARVGGHTPTLGRMEP